MQAIEIENIADVKKSFEQAIFHYLQQLQLAKKLQNKEISIQQQNDSLFWLGCCYLEQAVRTKDTTEAKKLFNQAIDAYQRQSQFVTQLQDKRIRTQEQICNIFWMGYCYLEQAIITKDITEAEFLFKRAIIHHQRQLEFARQLQDKQAYIQEQNNARYWLGRCYLEQAIATRDITKAEFLFKQAIIHHQRQLELARQLQDKQAYIQEQNNAQFGLGCCYSERAIKTKDAAKAKNLFKRAIYRFQQQLEFAKDLQDTQISTQEQNNALFELESCFRNMDFSGKEWGDYFNKKKHGILETLFSDEDNGFHQILKDAISTILAVLHIPPIELGSTPLAHYTSSTVCNKLFGVVNEDPSPMRIGSSTYMNDPSEGKGLLELLSLQDLELENKEDCSSSNAFFACFSARVNDLNQFRLYGKEDGVEASGCCLVFNKSGNWLREPDISAPYRCFIKNQGENSIEFELKGADTFNVEYENLPLYQVAYIAYKDEYIAEEKCKIWLDGSKFGIRLKPIGESKDWHDFRIKELEKALQQLIDFFKVKDNVNDQNKNVLEYIRYLFKDFAFRDEEEFRVLKIAEIGSEEIKYCETTKSIYLPYADISNVVDEVILGANYEKTNSRRKAEVFQHQMRQKCPNVKVSRSSLPIYANPPIKKD